MIEGGNEGVGEDGGNEATREWGRNGGKDRTRERGDKGIRDGGKEGRREGGKGGMEMRGTGKRMIKIATLISLEKRCFQVKLLAAHCAETHSSTQLV